MKDFVTTNNLILDEWRNTYVQQTQSLYPECKNPGDYFALDGIMNMGEIKPERKIFDNGVSGFRWKRIESGKENYLWNNSPLRILYLTKDQNTNGDVSWDVRSESLRYPDEKYKDWLDTYNIFFRHLAYSFYGIMKTTAGVPLYYNDIVDAKVVELLDRQIFARINCKKEVGENKCDNNTLEQVIYDKNYYRFLKQQVLNLEADLFICCGYSKSIGRTGNHMLNFLNTIGYNFKPVIEEWIYYDEERNKAAINSYHLSYPGFDYDGMMDAYSKFLQKCHKFDLSHKG